MKMPVTVSNCLNRPTAAVALFTSDVRAVPAALMLARAAGRTIALNIVFAVATKVCID